MNRSSNIGVIGYRLDDTSPISEKVFMANDTGNNISPVSTIGNGVVLDSLVHHQSPMYLMLNRTGSGKDIIIRSNNLGDIIINNSNRKSYPTGDNMNRLCVGGRLYPLSHGYLVYTVYGNNFDATSYQADNVTGSMEIITGIIRMNPYHKSNSETDVTLSADNGSFECESALNSTYRAIQRLIAVGSDTNYINYSDDGETWTSAKITDSNRSWVDVCYGNGKYVAISTGANLFSYSTDGKSWTESTISTTSRSWKAIIYAAGIFVIICSDSSYIAYSTNGVNWTEKSIGTDHNWTGICYGNGKFVMIGHEGYVAISTNGISWTISQPVESASWTSICYGNKYYVAVASDSALCAYSTDGTTWSTNTISSSVGAWSDIIYAMNTFVCCTNVGFGYSIGSPLAWNYVESPSTMSYPVLTSTDSMFIAFSKGSSTVLKSGNGKNWVTSNIGVSRAWTAVNSKKEYAIEFDNNHTGISTDKTDVNGVSSMVTLAEEYSDLVYYIHYVWVDRIANNSTRYNILTRKIDCSGSTPTIKNLVSMTTTMGNGNIAHPMFMKDLSGDIHCAFLYSDSTYLKYYKLNRTSSTDTSWTWSTESAPITIDSITKMTNGTYSNKQNQLDYSSSCMVISDNSGKCLRYTKVQE